MSADKRSVSTDALAVLGTLIDETVGRDAIHLAVEPVIAGEELKAGEDIGISEGKAYNNSRGEIVKFVGIVDPFLKASVKEGERFLLIVYPRQITSLRHVWEHPDFDEEEIVLRPALTIKTKIEIAEEWLRNYADEIDESYDWVMEVADSHQKSEKGHYPEYIIQGGRFEGESTPDEFWKNYAIVRGIDNPVKSSFFSCSC